MLRLFTLLFLTMIMVFNAAIDTQQVKATKPTLKIVEKQLSPNVAYVQVVLDNKAIAKKINSRLYQFAQQQQAYVDGSFKEKIAKAKMNKLDTTHWGYTAQFDVKPLYYKYNKLSVKCEAYEWSGGSHGTPVQTTFNFDLTTGAEIRLSQLISQQRAVVVNKYVKAEMIKINGDPKGPRFLTDGFKTVDLSLNQFYFTDKGITIYFNESYVVQPWVSSFPGVDVPQSLLN